MKAPTRTIKRRTMLPHHGRQIVLIIPPYSDVIQVRLTGTRKAYDISAESIYHLAVRQHVAAERAAKKRSKR